MSASKRRRTFAMSRSPCLRARSRSAAEAPAASIWAMSASSFSAKSLMAASRLFSICFFCTSSSARSSARSSWRPFSSTSVIM